MPADQTDPQFKFRNTVRISEADEVLADEVNKIHAVVAELQERLTLLPQPVPEDDVSRVVTVRMPGRLHEALLNEAHARKTSLNRLCLAKLASVLPAEAQMPEVRRH